MFSSSYLGKNSNQTGENSLSFQALGKNRRKSGTHVMDIWLEEDIADCWKLEDDCWKLEEDCCMLEDCWKLEDCCMAEDCWMVAACCC